MLLSLTSLTSSSGGSGGSVVSRRERQANTRFSAGVLSELMLTLGHVHNMW